MKPFFRKSPKTAHVAHFKPDYAPEYLMACNYICHLAVFRKSLFDAIGGERPGVTAHRIMICSCG